MKRNKVEPVVGNPEQMAAAIADALALIQDYRARVIRQGRYAGLTSPFDGWDDADETINRIEEALENYTED